MEGGREDIEKDKSRNNRQTGRVKGRAYKKPPTEKMQILRADLTALNPKPKP
jgi:hypothetical protein